VLVQTLRLKHGWSQQQLAEAAALSIRTIQRIEAGRPASIETLKSIAAAFDVDFFLLVPKESNMTTESANEGDKDEAAAFRYIRQLRRWYGNLFIYLIVCAGLTVYNLIAQPNHLWFYWVIGGWGIGIFMHALKVFRPRGWFGPEWERREVEKRLGRKL